MPRQETPTHAAVPTGAYTLQPKRGKPWLIALGIVAGLAVVLLGLFAAGILKLKGADGAPTLAAQTGPPDAVTPLKTEEITMPKDIYDWLEHLRKIELRKNELHKRQVAQLEIFKTKMETLGAAIGLLDKNRDPEESDPQQVTSDQMESLRPEWEQLLTDFESYPPPPECQPIADDYSRSLSEIPAVASDVNDILNTMNSDPQGAIDKLMRMQGKSTDTIDEYFKRTDEKVQDICDKYHMRKWFKIETDVNGGILGDSGGLGGLH